MSGLPITCLAISTSKRPLPLPFPMTRRSWWNASTTSSATGAWCCTVPSACRFMLRGRWQWQPVCTNAMASTARPWLLTMALCCAFPSWTMSHPAPTYSCLTLKNWTESLRPRWADLPSLPAVSANVPPGHCCSPGRIRASVRPCGSSASARPNCSMLPANIRSSRSCWKPCANACRMSMISPH